MALHLLRYLTGQRGPSAEGVGLDLVPVIQSIQLGQRLAGSGRRLCDTLLRESRHVGPLLQAVTSWIRELGLYYRVPRLTLCCRNTLRLLTFAYTTTGPFGPLKSCCYTCYYTIRCVSLKCFNWAKKAPAAARLVKDWAAAGDEHIPARSCFAYLLTTSCLCSCVLSHMLSRQDLLPCLLLPWPPCYLLVTFEALWRSKISRTISSTSLGASTVITVAPRSRA